MELLQEAEGCSLDLSALGGKLWRDSSFERFPDFVGNWIDPVDFLGVGAV